MQDAHLFADALRELRGNILQVIEHYDVSGLVDEIDTVIQQARQFAHVLAIKRRHKRLVELLGESVVDIVRVMFDVVETVA